MVAGASAAAMGTPSDSHLPPIGETEPLPGGGMPHLTWRELLASRAMARSAMRRGRNRARSKALLDRIESEIERRRLVRRDRLHARVPSIPALDD